MKINKKLKEITDFFKTHMGKGSLIFILSKTILNISTAIMIVL